MSAGNVIMHTGAFVGVAADVTITMPFTPRAIFFLVDIAGTPEYGFKTDGMAGTAYISTTTGTDAGVTIGDRSVLVANGADINSAAETTYFVALQ